MEWEQYTEPAGLLNLVWGPGMAYELYLYISS